MKAANRFLRIFLVLSFFVVFPGKTRAEEEIGEPIIVEAGEVEYFDGGKFVKGQDSVSVKYGDVELRCDRITVDIEARDAWAEGSVVLRRGDDVVTGDKATYNFEKDEGTIVSGGFRYGLWHGRTDEDVRLGKDEVNVEKSWLTTCDAEEPHYRITAPRVKIFPGERIVCRNAVLRIGKMPIMYLPYYSHPLKGRGAGVSLVPGSNDRWGYYLLGSLRYDITDFSSGYLHLDYRELKGGAYGVDNFFHTEKLGHGSLKTYYVPERDKEVSLGESRKKDRFLVQYRQITHVDENTTGYLEYYRAKDREVNKDYFFREYEKDPRPPSRLSVVRSAAGPDRILELNLRKRTNRFFDEVEKLPSVSLDIERTRLGGSRFYYSGETSFANLSKKTAYTGEDTDALRVDSFNELSCLTGLPGSFSWIKFSPSAGTRQTFYTKDALGTEENIFRGFFSAGGGLSTRLHGIFDVEGKYLGVELNRLKHILIPNVEYEYIHSPTVEAGQLGSFDDIDTFTRKNKLRLSIENKLQTRWPVSAAGTDTDEREVIDLVYLHTFIDYFPRRKTGEEDLSNLGIVLELRPCRWLSIETDTEFNPDNDDFETLNVDLFARKGEKWKLGAGHRYLRDSHSELTSDLTYRINDKWKVRYYNRYEFKRDRFEEREYSIYRDLHCWEAELTINQGGPATGDTVILMFRLKGFPDFPLGFSTRYHGRKGREMD